MLGIVPCAGEGSRWGGMAKELVPIGPNRWLIDHTLDAMRVAGVDRICIVASPPKIHMLVDHFRKGKYRHHKLFYVIQRERNELWEAMKESLPYAEDVNLFAMPDTMFDPQAFHRFLESDQSRQEFALGTFQTDKPERFGILLDGKFVDKPKGLPPGNYSAWGALVWSKALAEEWLREDPVDYTDAINRGVDLYGYHSFPLSYYRDFASWDYYCQWVSETREDQARGQQQLVAQCSA